MIKQFHECPNSIFSEVQKVTDGDYALCHMLAADPEYRQLFLESKGQGREIILDNSAFELGASVNVENLLEWVHILEPAWVVLPDVLGSANQTLKLVQAFPRHLLPAGTKTIGVVHGSWYEQQAWMYRQLLPLCDMIAFPAHKQERVYNLNRMEQDGVIDVTRPHHLLGCNSPYEFKAQRRPWIYSLDTSNPVVWGIYKGKYTDYAPVEKLKWESPNTWTRQTVRRGELDNAIANINTLKEWITRYDFGTKYCEANSPSYTE